MLGCGLVWFPPFQQNGGEGHAGNSGAHWSREAVGELAEEKGSKIAQPPYGVIVLYGLRANLFAHSSAKKGVLEVPKLY